MPTKSEFLAQTIEETFFLSYRELLAHFNVNAFKESLSSFMHLNYSPERLYVAPTEPGAYRRILAFSTITLLNRNAVTPLAEFNEAARADIDRLRLETDIDVELIEPAPHQPTGEELLEAQVRQDFVTLPSSKMREKRNNDKRYEAMYQRIADTLGSSVTSLTRAGA